MSNRRRKRQDYYYDDYPEYDDYPVADAVTDEAVCQPCSSSKKSGKKIDYKKGIYYLGEKQVGW